MIEKAAWQRGGEKKKKKKAGFKDVSWGEQTENTNCDPREEEEEEEE